ncbi:FUSC family protein [Pseudoduganella sp. UC29_106]|uniref:FUSC family protein n=1 Tax=Pseudoduganella sp. UC29_106 TaxID=3374553 RepID=UPI00375758DC
MFRHVLNTVAAALAALFLAMRLELPMPPIAMVCVFIVMQPATELVLAKSLYRLLGTVAGALAACALAALSASTAEFLAGLGVWAALLTAAATLSKQPRAYSIVLTGYTPILIGVPAIAHASHVGPDALARLAEVGIGIACATTAMLLNGPRRPQNPRRKTGVCHDVADTSFTPWVLRARDGSLAMRYFGIVCAAMATLLNGQRRAQNHQRKTGVCHDVADTSFTPWVLRARDGSLAGLYPALAMLAMASLWLATSWRGGGMATLNATVDCALIALAPQPLKAAVQMTIGTLGAVAAGLALQLAYPLFGAHWLLLAPFLALGAWLTGRQEALGAGLGFSITLSMLAYPPNAHNGQHLYDAAGLILSVLILTAIAGVLWTFRQQSDQP